MFSEFKRIGQTGFSLRFLILRYVGPTGFSGFFRNKETQAVRIMCALTKTIGLVLLTPLDNGASAFSGPKQCQCFPQKWVPQRCYFEKITYLPHPTHPVQKIPKSATAIDIGVLIFGPTTVPTLNLKEQEKVS